MAKISLFVAVLLSCLFFASAATSYTQTQLTANDLLVVRYALFLERLEKAFYDYGQTKWTTDAAFTSAGFPATTRGYFDLIRAHETSHVTALETAITSTFQSTLPAACTFNFTSVDTVQAYVLTARTLENLGTYAYIGAANAISDRSLLQTAATITTIEGRHAAYLNNITAAIPFPFSFDNITTPAQVVAAVQSTGFANGCTLPTAPAVLQTSFEFAALLFPNNTYVPGTAAQQQAVVDGNEADTLQYALYLERLEANFYVALLNKFPAAAFSGYGAFVRGYIALIGSHENDHVNFLQTALGSAALPSCTFNFDSIGNNLADWLVVARTFENVGVSAYDGTIGSFITRGTAQAAATIATVEARHAAFLNELTGQAPVPGSATADAFDATRTPAQVAQLVAPYVTCTASQALPRLPVIYSVQATTTAGSTTGATTGATTGITSGATTNRGATTNNAVTTSTSSSSAVAVSIAVLLACLVAVIMM